MLSNLMLRRRLVHHFNIAQDPDGALIACGSGVFLFFSAAGSTAQKSRSGSCITVKSTQRQRSRKHCIEWVYVCTFDLLLQSDDENNLTKGTPQRRRNLPAGKRIEKMQIN